MHVCICNHPTASDDMEEREDDEQGFDAEEVESPMGGGEASELDASGEQIGEPL